MKKVLSLVLVLCMVLCMSVSAFAVKADALEVDVDTAQELADILTSTNEKEYASLTINITADITWDTSIVWTSGYVNGYNGAGVYTLNGHGHTITGLNQPLFSNCWAGKAELHIKNLTLDSAVMSGGKVDSQGMAAFVAHSDSIPLIELTNCHLTNSTINGADWTGGMIGYVTGYAKQDDGPVFSVINITNCSVEGSEITGAGSTGAIAGHASGSVWTKMNISNTTVADNAITCTDDSPMKAGAVLGTVGAAGKPYEGKEGGVFVEATVYGNTVTSNGTEVNRIFGRFGSSGSVLTVTGGSYEFAKEDQSETDSGTLTISDSAVWNYVPKAEEPEEPFVPVVKEETYKTTIIGSQNGSVKADSKKVTRGEKVTLTVTPDKGYELAALLVIDEDGNERKVTENEDGIFSFRMPEGGVTVEAEFVKIGAVETAPSTEKENPSTGAADFVGAAAAALAVVSVMGMAALSLKK